MLSTLRLGRLCRATGIPYGRAGHTFLARPRVALNKPRISGQSTAGQLRRCGGEAPGKPPKGFEKFYRAPKERPAEAAEGESGAPKEAPKETPKEGAKDTAEGAKAGEGSRTKAEAKEKGGPGRGKKKDGEKPDEQTPLSQKNAAALVGAAVFSLYVLSSQEPAGPEITIQEMTKEYLIKGLVDKIQIVNKSYCRVHLRQEAPALPNGGRVVTIQLGTPEAFEAKLEQQQIELGITPLDFVPIQYVTETDFMSEFLPFLPSLLLLVPLALAARAMGSMGGMGGGASGGGAGGRNMFTIGKAFPAGQKDLKSKVKFVDVAGLEQAKKEVVEFVDFLKDPEKYAALGAKVPKGGLLVGPPGTGKTLLAKAVAGEADCPFYSMSGSDFIEMFVGVGPSRVRDLFQQARASAPSIIFIDEIDAVGRKRGKGGFSGGGNDERENTLNQMLVEMDGFSSGTGVVVLAGTNRADILDPALTRAGRFDRQIAIDKPDLREREAVYMVHLQPVKLHKDLAKESVAQRMAALTPGFAGADIANICNEAAIFAARRNVPAVEMQDFELATERVIGGLPKSNSLMSPADKRKVSIHESGHALAGWFLEYADPLLKVSIVPRSSGALGFAQYLPEEMALHSKEAILDKICVALAGRAAEEIFVGQISTGASDDLDKVTKMAYSMVSIYGMNTDIGLLSYNQNDASQQFYKPYSEETGRKIDQEARALVDVQYERVKALLEEKRDLLLSFADALSEKETLVHADIRKILGERPWGIKADYQKFVSADGNPFMVGLKSEDAESSAPAAENDQTPPTGGEEPPAANSEAPAGSPVAAAAAPASGAPAEAPQSPPR